MPSIRQPAPMGAERPFPFVIPRGPQPLNNLGPREKRAVTFTSRTRRPGFCCLSDDVVTRCSHSLEPRTVGKLSHSKLAKWPIKSKLHAEGCLPLTVADL
jgi:hypothetical protein